MVAGFGPLWLDLFWTLVVGFILDLNGRWFWTFVVGFILDLVVGFMLDFCGRFYLGWCYQVARRLSFV